MAVDVSQLRELVRDLRASPDKVAKGIVQVTNRGAMNIKKTMQADFRKSRHFGQIARSVNFDLTAGDMSVEAKVGPDKSVPKAGAALAHIAYWGGANGGGGTVRDPAHALLEEGDGYESALGRLLDGVL